MRKNKYLLLSLLLVFIVFVAVIVGAILANKKYYNPFKNSSENNIAFQVLGHTVFPDATNLYLSSQGEKGFNFGKYSQEFSISSCSELKEYVITTGFLKYDKNTISYSSQSFRDRKLTYNQSYFSENKIAKNEGFDNISSSSHYRVAFSLSSEKSLEDLLSRYNSLFDNSIARKYSSGVYFIAINTSDEKDVVCLGIGGNLASYNFMPKETFSMGIPATLEMDYISYTTRFENSLETLIQYKNHTDIFLKSGLFENCVNLNFKERQDFIEKNGINCIGFVANLRGDLLLTFKDDKEINLIEIEEIIL